MNKMNILYKLAIVTLTVSFVLLALGIITAYALERSTLSCLFSAGGCAVAFLGIVLAMLSKPKKTKEIQEALDNNESECYNEKAKGE